MGSMPAGAPVKYDVRLDCSTVRFEGNGRFPSLEGLPAARWEHCPTHERDVGNGRFPHFETRWMLSHTSGRTSCRPVSIGAGVPTPNVSAAKLWLAGRGWHARSCHGAAVEPQLIEEEAAATGDLLRMQQRCGPAPSHPVSTQLPQRTAVFKPGLQDRMLFLLTRFRGLGPAVRLRCERRECH